MLTIGLRPLLLTMGLWGWVGTAQWELTVEVAAKHASKCRAVLRETRVSKL
jgi:hypothetical protein